jgi:hypothetical protein
MSDDKILAIAQGLKDIPRGYLPGPIFDEIARLATLTAVEFIPLRKNGSSTEVLLIKRSSDDIFWPDALHTPGTILRATDASFEDAYIRLFTDELQCNQIPVTFIGNELILNNRGRTVLFKYIVDVTGILTSGTFYNVNSLPQNILPEHALMIQQAVKQF